jgi:hypothetical protein
MQTPNLFQLSGSGLHVTYSTTSINGQPRLNYQDAHGEARAFSGDQITATKTPIGTLVTVMLHIMPDVGTTTFSVLIPGVNLQDKAPHANIHTEGVTTIHRAGFAPQGDLGQIDSYTVRALHGTASAVMF